MRFVQYITQPSFTHNLVQRKRETGCVPFGGLSFSNLVIKGVAVGKQTNRQDCVP